MDAFENIEGGEEDFIAYCARVSNPGNQNNTKTAPKLLAYLIKNKQYISKDIFSDSKSATYFYRGGWQIKAVYAMVIGFIFAASTVWNVELRFLQTFAWLIGAIVSYITYYLLASE